MDKKILNDYIDICEFIKETETEIAQLEKRRKVVQDKVHGSNPEWPYEPRSFSVKGAGGTMDESASLEREMQIFAAQQKEARGLKLQVEEWMQTIPFRMQRIIRYKFFNKLTWDEAARLMGAKSGESLKKEFQRFMKEN